jgi:hypothetical protein
VFSFFVDLNPATTGLSSGNLISSGGSVLAQASIELNCTVPGVPSSLLPLTSIAWLNPEGVLVAQSLSMEDSLVLELTDLQLNDAGIYTCRSMIVSDLLVGGSLTISLAFNLLVQRKL